MELVEDFIEFLIQKGLDPNDFRIHGLSDTEEKEMWDAQFLFDDDHVDFVSFLDLFLRERFDRVDFRVDEAWLACHSSPKRFTAPDFTIDDVVKYIELNFIYQDIEVELDKLTEQSELKEEPKKHFKWLYLWSFILLVVIVSMFTLALV